MLLPLVHGHILCVVMGVEAKVRSFLYTCIIQGGMAISAGALSHWCQRMLLHNMGKHSTRVVARSTSKFDCTVDLCEGVLKLKLMHERYIQGNGRCTQTHVAT